MIRFIFSSALCLIFTLLSLSAFSNEIYFSENISHCAANHSAADIAKKTDRHHWLPPAVMDCGSLFFDPGGPDEDYQPGQSQLVTFCPESSDEFIVVDFNEFDLNPCCSSRLEVFEGITLSNPIFTFNAGNPAKLVSGNVPGGCLTFNFTADLNAQPAPGWEAEVLCSACQPPLDLFIEPIGPDEFDFFWFVNDPSQNFLLEIGNQGFTPGQGEAVYSEMTDIEFAHVFGLPGGNVFEAYVATLCNTGDTSVYFGPVTFQTSPGCGDTFYDSGGPDGNFPASDFLFLSICPDPGQIVSITFDSFDLGPCCNIMDIFTNNFSGTFEGTNNPGIISASQPDDCINIFFNAAGQSAPGWEATISCVTCPPPFNVEINQVSSTTVDINWAFQQNASFYYYEIGLPGFMPGTGQQLASANIVNNSITIPGLQGNTDYEFAVRTHCGNSDTSAFSTILPFKTSPSCGDPYYDPGGPDADYPPFQNVTSVICPDQSGTFIQAEFDSFSLAPNIARLDIRDGNGFGPFLGSWSGQNSPGTITATNQTGCLTFIFFPNGSSGYGWDASISCISCPAPNNVSISFFNTNTNFSWPFNNSASSYVIEIGAAGFAPGTGESVIRDIVFQTNYSTDDLEGGETFEVYIQSICAPGDSSVFAGPFPFSTPPSCGDTFYDPGGPDEDYPLFSNTETLICPNSSLEFAQIVFTEFDIDPCCNNMFILDGQNFVQIQLGSGIPEPIIAAFPGECMTVIFESFDDHDAGTGWAADINCVACPPPKNVIIRKTTSSSVVFEWLSIFINESVQWEIGLPGFVPGTNSAISMGSVPPFNTVAEANGLITNTAYELYLKNLCQGDTSNFFGPISFTTAPSCGDSYFDPGGPNGNYDLPFSSLTTTICPNMPNTFVEVTFSEFELNPFGNDILEVYNGPDLGISFIGSFIGSDLPPQVTSSHSTGCLTFNFNHFSGQSFPGWAASLDCVSCPPVFGITAENVTTNSATIIWEELSAADAYFWEIGTPGFLPGNGEALQLGTNTSSSSTSSLIEDLESGTFYEVYVWAECSPGPSKFGSPFQFSTQPTCGDFFYDPGGPNAQYLNNSSSVTTICPPHDGIDITVTFNLFNTQACCDILNIFDGPSSGGQFLGSFSGSALPGPFTSSHPSGCLTFQFNTDSNGGGNGWEAIISCDPLDVSTTGNFAGRFDIYPNPTSSELNILFEYPASETAALEVTDVTGRLVLEKKMEALSGENQVKFKMDNMPDGIYLVSLKGKFGRAVDRVVKIN